MEDKVAVMSDRSNFSTDAKHKVAQEKFDKQHTELQVSKEKTCRKFKLEKTDRTPLWGQADRRQQIYKWVGDIKKKTGKPKDMWNMEQAY